MVKNNKLPQYSNYRIIANALIIDPQTPELKQINGLSTPSFQDTVTLIKETLISQHLGMIDAEMKVIQGPTIPVTQEMKQQNTSNE